MTNQDVYLTFEPKQLLLCVHVRCFGVQRLRMHRTDRSYIASSNLDLGRGRSLGVNKPLAAMTRGRSLSGALEVFISDPSSSRVVRLRISL